MTPSASLGTTATSARVVTIPSIVAGATFTLTVAGVPYTSSASDSSANAVAADLAGQVNDATGFAATAILNQVYVLATTTNAFDATLAQNAATYAFRIASPQAGDTVTLTFAPDTSSASFGSAGTTFTATTGATA